ncbi:MAG: heparinase II/III domain-containing protein [Armatimonadota bacterium]
MDKLLLLVLLLALLSVFPTAASAKTARTFYDDALMTRVKQKLQDPLWASDPASARASCEWLVKMSDQELWDFIPPPEQMRAINVCIAHDCPTCGDEVNRKAGHYPWIISRDLPFKVKCPVCEGVFPKNDFKPWSTEGLEGKPSETTEPTDNGLGWVDKKDGRRYWFVPYYIFWQRWSKDVLGGINDLKTAYLLTGDPVYAHKAAVMMAKIASEYDRLDYPKQCYHEGMFGIRGRIMDYIWSTGNNTRLAQAYDAVFPALAEDAELTAFLKNKALPEPRELIETKMLYPMVKDVMSGYVAGNMGMHQVTLATLAIVLDNNDPKRGPTTKDMADWLMSGGGRIEDLLWNGFVREGLGAESSPGYASGWGNHFYEVAHLLPKLGVDIWSNPKLKKMADIGLDLTVTGAFCPCIGDSGALKGGGPIGRWAGLQGPAFMHYRDPRHARALVEMGAKPGNLFEEYFDAEAVSKAAADTPDPAVGLSTRNLGGYGLAILEAGSGTARRGLSLYYGDAGGGHGHYDRLNVEMFAFGMSVMPDDGYPTPFTRPDFHEWRRANTYKHHCVMIDELPQMTLHAGQLQAIAGTPEVQYVDVSAESAYPNTASLYRRTCALLDISPDQSYLLDIFRVRGGSQHDWCYHSAVPQMTVTGGTLGPVQAKGTLAGEDVAYGKRPPLRVAKGGTAFDLQHGEGVKTGGDYWKLAEQGWSRHAEGIFTVKPGSEVALSFPKVPAGKYNLLTQYWDHKPGKSEIELTLGKQTIPLVIQTQDGKAYKWMSQIIDLAEPAEMLRIVSKSTENSYILLNRLVLSTDLQATEPTMASETVSSGFQGLWNVQRMNPQGAWSTSWTQPEKNVTVTMTMPAGCAQEVIIADGEPEAQPGNPRSIKYALARNSSTSGEALLSNYVSVIEPHVGAAKVTSVRRLQAEKASPETVGVQVQREGATDFVHSALSGEGNVQWQQTALPFSATGEFATVTVDTQGVQRAVLVNGTALRYGDFRLEVAPAPQGKVISVDLARNTATLDVALPAPDTCVGREIIFSNPEHQTSFTITSAKVADGKTVIGFGDILSIAGMAFAAGSNRAEGTVDTTTPIAGYGKTFSGRHQGRWLYNDDKSQGLRIKSCGGTRFVLDSEGKDLGAIYKDIDNDGRNYLWISDVGPGDSFRLPSTTYVQRVRPNLYRVQTLTQAQVSVPTVK